MTELVAIATLILIALGLIYKDWVNKENKPSIRKGKIWYDNKYRISRFKYTLRKSQLNSLGLFETTVIDKAIIRPYKRKVSTYILFIETATGDYGGMITVNANEYNKYKIGDFYGKRIVLENYIKPGFIIMTDENNHEDAIRSVTYKARLFLLSIIFLILLMSFSLLAIIGPILSI